MSTTAFSTTNTKNTDSTGTKCTVAMPHRSPIPCRKKPFFRYWAISAANCATGMSISGRPSTPPATPNGMKPTPPTSTTRCSAWCSALPTNIALPPVSNTRCCPAMWVTFAAVRSTPPSAKAICTKSCATLPSAMPSLSTFAATAAANSLRPKPSPRPLPIVRSPWATSPTKPDRHTTRSRHRNPYV